MKPSPGQSAPAALANAFGQYIQGHFGSGHVADYIPALVSLDPRQFGLTNHTCTGETAAVDDCRHGS